MRKTTPTIRMLAVILLLGAWDSSLLQAQEPTLFGAWERQGHDEKGAYVDRLWLGEDDAFSWTSTFTGRLDALLGMEEITVGSDVYTFRVGWGTFATTFQGTYGVVGDRLALTGTVTEIRINEESLRAFYTQMAEQFITQYAEKVGRVLGDAERETRKEGFVEGAMKGVEAQRATPWRPTYTFRLVGEVLRWRDANGQEARWQRVSAPTGVSAASWGQVKAWSR